jgi:hypothetical protein
VRNETLLYNVTSSFIFVLFAIYYEGDQIREGEMNGAYNSTEKDEK